MFAEALQLTGPGGLFVPVATPEHLIAMKLTAIQNDPSRTFQNLADIQFLLTQANVDRELVRSRFKALEMEDRYDELQKNT